MRTNLRSAVSKPSENRKPVCALSATAQLAQTAALIAWRVLTIGQALAFLQERHRGCWKAS